jgi:nucleoid DNA-binding protein
MDFNEWEHATWKLLEDRSPVEADRDYTHAEVRTVMQASLQTLINELANGGNLCLANFGRFQVITRRPRLVTSNLGKETKTYNVQKRRVVRFRASSALEKVLGE